MQAIKTNPHLYPEVGSGGSEFTLTSVLGLPPLKVECLRSLSYVDRNSQVIDFPPRPDVGDINFRIKSSHRSLGIGLKSLSFKLGPLCA